MKSEAAKSQRSVGVPRYRTIVVFVVANHAVAGCLGVRVAGGWGGQGGRVTPCLV